MSKAISSVVDDRTRMLIWRWSAFSLAVLSGGATAAQYITYDGSYNSSARMALLVIGCGVLLWFMALHFLRRWHRLPDAQHHRYLYVVVDGLRYRLMQFFRPTYDWVALLYLIICFSVLTQPYEFLGVRIITGSDEKHLMMGVLFIPLYYVVAELFAALVKVIWRNKHNRGPDGNYEDVTITQVMSTS